jgi:YD repeat-containing protein
MHAASLHRNRFFQKAFAVAISIAINLVPFGPVLASPSSTTPTVQNPNVFTFQNSAPKVNGETGALTERIPLDIPPGRNGLQPDLALQYNSQDTEDSIVGYGWSLSIPSIQRLNKVGSQELYDNNNQYFTSSLDGELSPYGVSASSTYRAKVDEGSFDLYSYATSTNTWTMYDKNGTRYLFGSDDQSRQESTTTPTKIYTWMLREVRDTNNNYVKYTYNKDYDQIYPSEIVYTGNGVTDGNITIDFATSTRPDAYTSYKPGFKVITNYYVTEIKASISGTWVRKIDLTYQPGNNGFRSMLSSVQETGQDDSGGQVTLPAMTFGYVSTSTMFYATSSPTEPISSASYVVADTNGDGINDVNLFTYNPNVGQTGSSILIDQTTFPGGIHPPDYWAINTSSTTPVERGTRYLDLNADGMADIARGLQDDGNSTTTFALWNNTYASSTGYAWTSSTWSGTMPRFAYENATNVMTTGIFGDINGDGLPDYVMALSNTGTSTYTGNGSAFDATTTIFVAPKSMPTTVQTGTNSQLVDVNGDGLADWVYSDASSTYVLLNTGNGWEANPDPEWTIGTTTLYLASSSPATYYDRGIRFFDINGDGLPDLIHSYSGISTTSAQYASPEPATYSQVFLNTGHGWATSTAYTLPAYITSATTPWTGTLQHNEYGNWIGNGQMDQDVLSTINYPKGGTTNIYYSPTAQQGTNPQLPISLLTVSKIIVNDGQGNSSETDYSYSGGKLFLSQGVRNRKFAGFASSAATSSASAVITYFNQDDGTSTSMGEQSDGYGQMGHPFREDVTDLSSNLLQRTYYRWDTNLLNGGGLNLNNLATSSIVSYWKFDEAATSTASDSVGVNPLTNINAITYSTGMINSAAYLASASLQYFSRPSQVGLASSGDETVNGWVYFSTLSGTNDIAGIWNGNPGQRSWIFDTNGSGSNLEFAVTSATNTTTSVDVPWSPSTGQWYMLTAVYTRSPSSVQFYVNGLPLGSVHTGLSLLNPSPTTDFEVGAQGGNAGFLDGRVDEMGVWSQALTANQVLALYNGSTLVHLGSKLTESYNSDGTHTDKATTYVYATSTQNLVQTNDFGQVTGNSDGTFTDTGSDSRTTVLSYAASTSVNMYLPYEKTLLNASSSTTTDTRLYYDNLALGSVNVGNQTKEEDLISGSQYASSTKTYTAYGLVATSTDPLGHTTANVYDSVNFYPATTTNALSQSTGFLYNYSIGKVKQSNDPNGRLTKNTFDGVGRLTQVSQSDVSTPSTLDTTIAYVYTDNTTTPSVVHESDYLTSTSTVDIHDYYDGLGRLIQDRHSTEGSATSSVKDTIYNLAGLVGSSTLPYFSAGTSLTTATSTNNLYTNFIYDGLNRLTTTKNVLGTTNTTYTGWTASTTDANGNTKKYTKDAYGNLAEVDEVNASATYSTLYTYDAANNLTKLTDANGNIRNFTYDGLNRLLTSQDLHATSSATFGTLSYFYDLAGNVASSTDPKAQEIDYTYDALNRPLTENSTTTPSTSVTYTYDSCTNGIGYLCTASSSAAKTANVYDILGRVTSSTSTINFSNYTTSYTYDLQGNPLTITYPDGRSVSYGYNTAGLVKAVSTAPQNGSTTPVVTSVNYAPDNRPTFEAFNNGIQTNFTYDLKNLYRLTRKGLLLIVMSPNILPSHC